MTNNSSTWIKNTLMLILAISYCMIGISCSNTPIKQEHIPLENTKYLPKPDINVNIPSLSSCTYTDDKTIRLNSHEPIVIIVHGCFSSAGRFRSLADVFALHGQQAICFEYNDRDSLTKSSSELISSLRELSKKTKQTNFSIVSHSQGGLIARRAFINERKDKLMEDDIKVDLTTISAPFGGIKAASHCGSTALAWLSLGLTIPICQLITGDKYSEIPPNSEFIKSPGTLLPNIKRHIKIVTDESNSCRQYANNGVCTEDDYVFSIEEQTNQLVDEEAKLTSILSKAGHVEIVGDENISPQKLISILQNEGIMNNTPANLRKSLAQLISKLYFSD